MGSPLSPVMANVSMEEFEKKALASSTLKVGFWKNQKEDETIPFLDVLLMSQEDGSLGGHKAHKVYREPTHAHGQASAL